MKTPPVPHIESLRLSTLQALNILDTEPDDRFDRITRIAQRMFDVPISLVSLVDCDRQWFKSRQGLEARETPRDISFCGHAILDDEIFVVADTAADPRFADNPLVTGEPFIRFYAGCPIAAANGHKLGTLCLIDREPRAFTADDRAALRDLASMVESEIEAIQIAQTDDLTKLSNCRGFRTLAPHYLNFCTRQKIPCSLVFIDMNDFKQINDVHGHNEGDSILVSMSLLMQQYFRQTDLVARVGGDEFVVLLSNTSESDAVTTMEKFSERLKAQSIEERRPYNVSISFGVSQYDSNRHSSIVTLKEEADSRMYAAKHNKVVHLKSV